MTTCHPGFWASRLLRSTYFQVMGSTISEQSASRKSWSVPLIHCDQHVEARFGKEKSDCNRVQKTVQGQHVPVKWGGQRNQDCGQQSHLYSTWKTNLHVSWSWWVFTNLDRVQGCYSETSAYKIFAFGKSDHFWGFIITLPIIKSTKKSWHGQSWYLARPVRPAVV